MSINPKRDIRDDTALTAHLAWSPRAKRPEYSAQVGQIPTSWRERWPGDSNDTDPPRKFGASGRAEAHRRFGNTETNE